MATVPLSGTNIKLLSGIKFSNDYKHTRWFDSVSDQNTFFANQTVVHSMNEANFQRMEGYYFISVNKSIDELWGTNYLMFQNASYNSKWFYGFVTKLEYVQRNTTYVHFEMDVLQTWMFDFTFKPSFIIREHCNLWDSDGHPILNTVDEGLNYGTDYDIVEATQWKPNDDLLFLVAVTKTAIHSGFEGKYYSTLNGVPQLMNFYICPFKSDGSAPSTSLGTVSQADDFMVGLYNQDSAVNNVVSLYITDVIPDFPTYDGTILSLGSTEYERVSFPIQVNSNTVYCLHALDVSYGSLTKTFGDKYTGYKSVTESKLLMYPYTKITLTDFRGNQIDIKNEYIRTYTLMLDCWASLGMNHKTVYTFKDYLTNNLTDDNIKAKVNLGGASIVSDEANDLPVLTDLLSAYLQGHRNSIENRKNSIYFNGAMDAIMGSVNTAAAYESGNGLGAINSAGGVIKGAGNSVLKLQAIEAQQSDIKNVPPSVAKQGSNTYFDFGNDLNGVWILKKQITNEYITKLTNFFNMYGYKVNETKVPNFHTRQNWNFIQTESCVITGNFNNEDLQEIKDAFDNGITLWHTDDIGNYALANGVI